MLTPIKKQGDEHICIQSQPCVITYKSIHYTNTNGLIRMLIGSEITCVCFLDILHKVHIGGNHSGSGSFA